MRESTHALTPSCMNVRMLARLYVCMCVCFGRVVFVVFCACVRFGFEYLWVHLCRYAFVYASFYLVLVHLL